MDTGVITALVTAFGAAVAAVIGAFALLKRATVPMSKARLALEALWQWLELHDLVDKVPERTKRNVLRIIDAETDDDEVANK